jgi:hypothetical protein
MNAGDRVERARRDLKRLLANGRLTAMPKRPSDQELVAALAAARFDPQKSYSEAAVNEQLAGWLVSISEEFGIDHVSLRRLLVDLRLLVRTSSGSAYRVNETKAADLDAVRAIDPALMAADIQAERSRRKQAARPEGS